MAKKARPASVGFDEHDYRAESDLRTLIDAEKIKADPKRMKAAMAKKRELHDAVRKIKG